LGSTTQQTATLQDDLIINQKLLPATNDEIDMYTTDKGFKNLIS